MFTRHNAGFWVIDELAHRCAVSLKEACGEALLARASLAGQNVVLARPLTYMNRSGVAIKALMRHFSVSPPDLLVFYDDMDLPLGRLRLRPGGGSGGHLGLESIIALVSTENIPRLRLGVGKGEDKEEKGVVQHLLTPFSVSEERIIQRAVIRAADAAELYLQQGIEAAMNKYNPLQVQD